MPGSNPSHWLHRLSAAEWLAAAENELDHADQALARRAFRPAVTHARRAAGMALNAVLVVDPDEGAAARWGRSYMDHVVAIANDAAVPEPVRAAARDLRETAPAPPEVVQIGRADPHVATSARAIVAWARARCGVVS